MTQVNERQPTPTAYTQTAQVLPLLDLHIPTPYRDAVQTFGQIPGSWRWLKFTASEFVANAIHTNGFFKYNAIPDLKTPRPGRWSLEIFRLRSTKPTAWATPLRELALAQYIKFNEAQARGDIKAMHLFAIPPMTNIARDRIRGRKTTKLVWKYHGEAGTSQCLSIRTIPDTGFGLPTLQAGAIQLLVRFDTYQSLAIYDSRGNLLKGSTTDKNRVVDYMVFERKMWDPVGWVLKAQVYETGNA